MYLENLPWILQKKNLPWITNSSIMTEDMNNPKLWTTNQSPYLFSCA